MMACGKIRNELNEDKQSHLEFLRLWISSLWRPWDNFRSFFIIFHLNFSSFYIVFSYGCQLATFLVLKPGNYTCRRKKWVVRVKLLKLKSPIALSGKISMIYRFLLCCATRWIVPSQRLRSTRTRVNALYGRRQYQQDHTDGPGINCTRHPWLGSHEWRTCLMWIFFFSRLKHANSQSTRLHDKWSFISEFIQNSELWPDDWRRTQGFHASLKHNTTQHNTILS